MLSRLFARILSAALFCSFLPAQESGTPVIIDGKEVLRVYGTVGQFTANDRAPEIADRIIALAEKRNKITITIRAIPSENATALVAGPLIIMGVTVEDAQASGMPQEVLAQQYAAAVQNAIEQYRVHHSLANFLLALVKTSIAWVLFCAAVWLARKAFQWWASQFDAWLRRKSAKRVFGGFHLMLLQRTELVAFTVVKGLIGLSVLVGLSLLISYSFSLFPETAGISITLLDYLRNAFDSAGAAILHYLPNGGLVLLVGVLTHYLLKLLRFLALAVENGDLSVKSIHPEMAKPTYQLLRLVVVLFALVIVFPYLPGGNSEAFKGISILLGLMLSLGSSSAVSNVLAGLVLTYMRPFRAGDRVKIVDTTGDVVEKTLLVTRLRTIKNEEIVIPNGAILSNQIFNYSALARSQGLILHTTVTIGYSSSWRTVHDLLIRAALRTDGILANPAPFVLETSLNDFHISYELNAYTDRPNDIQNIYSHLHEAIQDSFNTAGVEIMSPGYYALRDGNTVTIPEAHQPNDSQPSVALHNRECA